MISLPKLKSAPKRVGVVAQPAARRQRFQFADVSPSENDVVGQQRGSQAGHDIGYVAAPLLQAMFRQSTLTHIVLKCALLVGQMSEFHGLDDSIHNKCRSQPGSQAEKEHPAASVAAQSLHGGVIDQFHRTVESGFEIEADPSGSKIMRFRNRPALEHRAGISDRYHVIVPIRRGFLNAGDHLLRRHVRSGRKPPADAPSRRKNLDVVAADVHNQHSHDKPSRREGF